MISFVQSWTQEDEAHFLERLRDAYEGLGFTFTVHPGDELIPGFLAPYRPDAIAQKPGENIAIEVKFRQNSSTNRTLADIRRRFSGHPEWKLDVVYVHSDRAAQAAIPPAEIPAVRRWIDEAAVLNDGGHSRVAFVLAWSLLEAALNSLGGETANRTRNPGQVVQGLAMNGYIDSHMERQLRVLADLRNRIVHGDLSVDASPQDVDQVLAAVEEVLAAEAA